MLETYVIAPDGTPERLIQRLENATPGNLFYCEADREEAVEIAQEEFATALAEARAEGRRQGLEEAATKAEGQLAYWRERMRAEKCLEDGISEEGETYTPIGDVAAWQSGSCNGHMSEAEWWIGTLRSLATNTPETQDEK